jgi:tRNA(Ile)-lysidine synthase
MAAAAADASALVPPAELIDRFRAMLNPLVPADGKLGVAVSGGADSLALLLLAAAARPGAVEAATVDHGLRAEAGDEARMVADLCARLGIRHEVLTVNWGEVPSTALQERAREARYALLRGWAGERGLRALLTAHHLDDQAETLLMRLTRGAGVRGLGAMRSLARTPGGTLPLVRPLLGWRSAVLSDICDNAGVTPSDDPGNRDQRFERARVRAAMAEADWLDPVGLAQSAQHLSEANEALAWATAIVWRRTVRREGARLLFEPGTIPREIRRRVVARAVERLSTEGAAQALRGRELDQLLAALRSGRKATLRGVLCSGGNLWTFEPAPPRSA